MSSSRVDLAAGAAIVVLGLAVYAGVGDNGFYKDDYLWMIAARDDMGAGNLLFYQVVGFFRPFTNLVFYLSERIAPASSSFYNLGNLVVHLLNAWLCYRLFRVLVRGTFVPVVAALFFTVAYTHSGAILWVAARTTLLMTTFTLAALIFLARGGRGAVGVALIAFAFALATKETAVAALGLAGLVVWYGGAARANGKGIVVGFAAVTAVYLVVRTVVLGTAMQTAWAIGPHALNNLMGAMVYVYYPWDLTTYMGASAVLRGSSVGVWPEILAIPVVAILVYAAGKERRTMVLALVWIAVALLPCIFFGFRFLGQVSHVHNRYYYLAGVGVALSVAVLLDVLRTTQATTKAGNAVAGFLLAVILASNVHAGRDLEAYWGDSNRRFASLVDSVVEQLGSHMEEPTVVVTGMEGWQPHLTSAIRYRHTERPVIYEPGGEAALAQHAPCLFVRIDRAPDGEVSLRMFSAQ